MRRVIAVLWGLAACGGATAPTAPISNTPPPRARTPVALSDVWAKQERPEIAAVSLAGPFARLDDVCAALHAGSDACTTSAGESGMGSVSVWQPTTQEGDMPERLEHLAVQGHQRWYVMPGFAETGNRYSSFAYESASVEDVVVVSYQIDTATAGRFAGDSEHGIVICKPLAAGVACTPKIATRRYSQSMNTSAPDWPTNTVIDLACVATYAHGTLSVVPMPSPTPPDELWTAEAAQACTSLAYAGTHAVVF